MTVLHGFDSHSVEQYICSGRW